MSQMRKPTWALVAVIVGLLLLCGVITVIAASRAVNGPQQQQEWVETEDCDAEDWAHYEPECYRVSPKPKASPRKTIASRTTR
jgi:hypothetical protein